MKINFNEKTINRIIAMGGLSLILTGVGCLAIENKYGKPNSIKDNKQYEETQKDTIVYSAPLGYTIENHGNRVVAVRDEIQVKPILLGDGEYAYVAPEGYTLKQYADGTVVAVRTNIVVEKLEPEKEYTK